MNKDAFLGKNASKLAVAGVLGVAALAAPGYIRPSEAQTSRNQNVGVTAVSANVAVPSVNTDAVRQAVGMQAAFNQVARAVEPAVVTIATMESVPTPRMDRGMRPFSGPGGRGGDDSFDDFFRRFFGPDGVEGLQPNDTPAPPSGGSGSSGGRMVRAGLGSGFIFRSDGLIITNAHVVRGASTVTVKLSNGQEFKNAKVLGQDATTDVAVVKIPATNLPTVPLGDSDQVNVGDWAIAVGNPFGLDHTLTVGVISAKGREVPLSDSGPGQYLQTDASINPGNSGGPLLDIYGRVIGVNNAIYSRSGGNVGIGFAIPISTARKIADTLVKDGRVRRARLGIAIANIDDRARAFGLDASTTGVLVEQVEPDGPAARAGLEPGDVITAANGKSVKASSELQSMITSSPIGSSVRLEILRAGAKRTIEARVEELKQAGETASGPATDNDRASNATTIGVQIAPLTPEIASQLGLKQGARGVVVMGVQSNSAADAAGIQRGDVIERVGQTMISSPEEMKTAIKNILDRQSSDSKSVALYVNRKGVGHYVLVSP